MKASSALQGECPDPFLRCNGSPDPALPCSRPQEAPAPLPDGPHFPSPESLSVLFTQESCPPFTILSLQVETLSGDMEKTLSDLGKEQQDRLHITQENNIFFLLLQDKGPEEAEKIFHKLKTGPETAMNAGIFTYPLDGFTAARALEYSRKTLTHSLLLGPDSLASFDAVTLNISGDEAYQEGRMDEAIEEYEAALRLDPENANVLNSLGVCFGVIQNYERALNAFRRSHAADPKEAMPVYNEGLIHEMQGEKQRAKDCFEKALCLSPDSFESAFHLGKSLVALEDPEAALPFLEKARTIKPENGPVLKFLAEACFRTRETEKAFHLFRQALRRMPRDAAVLSGLGACFDLKGENPDIAATFCEEALAIEPDNGLFALRLARIRIRQNRNEEARSLLLMARKNGQKLSREEENGLN
ncbi:tetratricopeptide (TPR) repeat protein [Desulfobotulus alkaliphilus]|uniref:Tetratricopeptide (TPR) repeat protein n=1 Tax=Desulfobotulus alkaliphilus TaxID=622671 RepID=A0A562RRK6_9BACT|nr:tetratricopeptide repeat protein [Desulfobotulus alkaliphilus]TWI71662.1 tetratricopeptide (TPR) repeat protein [Desulfobotulus alkaliphilus]